ncbi:hypothetical protein [Chitinophaga nivalis]|uniref:Bulb-type lectin domain-containing protein n=1 Tax=Chitinophaga nivalis TaxID=2991709 RepID=A0ABT3IRZ9_9BACT|nr:hypothetical protein [Chitinophaga nivalis]MCW3463548.1 hypothetical protein [Chitinophaga nivalis]MCW3486762.1 hypothetical protein [Chitinophaga nivalis]
MKLFDVVRVGVALGLLFGITSSTHAQQLKLGANPTTTRSSALLELESKKQALLLTRITDTALIANPIDGMIIFLDVDNSLRVRANNYWMKIMSDGMIKSINNDATAAQKITTSNIDKPFAFSLSGPGQHTLTVPDANLTTRGFINTAAQTFAGLKTFDGVKTATLAVTTDAAPAVDRLLGKDATTGNVSGVSIDNTTLKISATRQLSAANTALLWNAAQINTIPVATTTPNANDVLTYDGTSKNWVPKAVSSSGGGNDFIKNSTTSVQTADFNISGYGDIGKNLTVGGNITTAANLSVAGSVLLNNAPAGAVPFIGGNPKGLAYNAGQFFWSESKAALGLGTGNPNNKLEIAAPLTTVGGAPYTSGLRLTNLGAAKPGAASLGGNKVLSVNATGDVIVVDNNAAGWAFTGNNNIDSTKHFIGTTNDQALIFKYNNNDFLRGTHGVGGYEAYTVALFNGAVPYNAHPFIIRANENDVMAFQDKTGRTRWHWNLIGNGLNFVETGVTGGDYRLYMAPGGNIGIGTNSPATALDVRGTTTTNALTATTSVTTNTLTATTSVTTNALITNSFAASITSITGSYTVGENDHTIITLSRNNSTVSLPRAVPANKGRMYVIKKGVKGDDYTTIQVRTVTPLQNIDFNTTYSLNNEGEHVKVQSDGNQWWVIGN